MLEPYSSVSASSLASSSSMSQQTPFNYSVDLLWRETNSGTGVRWTMSGANVVGGGMFTMPDPSWKVAATADVNRDGETDVLWRHSVSGGTVWWILQNQSFSSAFALPTLADLNWTIAGTGDVNGDQKLDVLWRNTATGDNAWWFMQDGQIIGSISLPKVDPGWTIVSTGDCNRDGYVDLLWRNRTTGDSQWWLMQGSQIIQGVSLPSNSPTVALVGAYDLNQDGQLDLVWRDYNTGANSLWIMQGATVLEKYDINAVVGSSWQIVGFLSRPKPEEADAGNSLLSATIESTTQFFRAQRVSVGDLNDVYQFTVAQSGIFTAHLTGLSGDADVKLIQNSNGNDQIDSGEILAWQWERGTNGESLRRFLNPGTYYLQVNSYNNQSASYAVSTNFRAAAVDDQKFSLSVTYGDGTSGLNAAARQAIAEAASYWGNVITSRSAITQYQNLNIQLVGLELSDYNLLAYAGPNVTTDWSNLFIVSGNATINTRRLADFNSNPSYLRSLMIHEFAHALGLGTLWVPVEFRQGNSSTLVGRTYINKTTATYNANTYAAWAYGELLGTYNPTAIPIEAGVFQHWDEYQFDTELMTPYAESVGIATPTSQMTLAALRDLGWNINYGAAQPYSLPSYLTASSFQIGIGSNSSGLSAAGTAANVSNASQSGETAFSTKSSTVEHVAVSCGCAKHLGANSLYTIGATNLAHLI
ncbi:FG-GAP-like repeat-containing protein [Alkalinema pantanalense CENA528]|uniref:FG-GAP-like repeat-containing protein n=1 Tax=Alkalinema pantanalense TaxID=1620705 RepID=UPI003D6EF6E9